MSERKGYIISDQYAMYYITMTTVGWVDIFTRKECKDIIIDSLKYCISNKGLEPFAYVILPSHCHMILKAEESSDGLLDIHRDMKKHTSKQILNWVYPLSEDCNFKQI